MSRAILLLAGGAMAPSTTLDLSSGGTFARALAAFYFTGAPTNGSSAFLASAASGVRRIEDRGDFMGACLLMEKSATNLIRSNRNPTGTGWSTGIATAGPPTLAGNGPDGVNTAYRGQFAAGEYNNFHGPLVGALAIGAKYYFSMWGRANSGTSSTDAQIYDGASHLYGTPAALTTTYFRDGFAWTAGGVDLYGDPWDGRGPPNSPALAGGDYWVDLQQVEESNYPTSPIATTIAVVTRPADTLSYATGAYPVGFLTSGVVIDFAFDASSAEIVAAGEDWRLVQNGANDFVRVRANGGGCDVDLVRGSTVIATRTITFARGQRISITAKPSAGSLIVSGAMSGNGTSSGAGGAWTAGQTLYVGGDNAGANNVTGRYVGHVLVQAP